MNRNKLIVIFLIIIAFVCGYGIGFNKNDKYLDENVNKYFAKVISPKPAKYSYLNMEQTYNVIIEILNAQRASILSNYEDELENNVVNLELFNYKEDETTVFLQYKIYEDKEHYYVSSRDKDVIFVLHKYYAPNIKKMIYGNMQN